MAVLAEHAVVQAVYVWQPSDGQPAWLVTFDFAEIHGRIECIGMAMRSYIRDRAEDASGNYPAYRTGGAIKRSDLFHVPAHRPASPLSILFDPTSAAYREWKEYLRQEEDEGDAVVNAEAPDPFPRLARYDPEALEAVLYFGDLVLEPRPLRAVTLRTFPFSYCMNRARQQIAEYYSIGIVPRHVTGAPRAAQRRAVKKVVTAFAPKERKGGRPGKWTIEDLKEVARLYKEAWRTGTSSPTKDVAIAMGIKVNVAAKLVSRCRNPKIALLPPTERRKAGWTGNPLPAAWADRFANREADLEAENRQRMAELLATIAEMEKSGKTGEPSSKDEEEPHEHNR